MLPVLTCEMLCALFLPCLQNYGEVTLFGCSFTRVSELCWIIRFTRTIKEIAHLWTRKTELLDICRENSDDWSTKRKISHWFHFWKCNKICYKWSQQRQTEKRCPKHSNKGRGDYGSTLSSMFKLSQYHSEWQLKCIVPTCEYESETLQVYMINTKIGRWAISCYDNSDVLKPAILNMVLCCYLNLDKRVWDRFIP